MCKIIRTCLITLTRDMRSVKGGLASGQAIKDVDAQMAALDNLKRKIEGITVTGSKALDKGGGGAKKAETEAEKARKDELKSWQDYYKERESESKKWIDKQLNTEAAG